MLSVARWVHWLIVVLVPWKKISINCLTLTTFKTIKSDLSIGILIAKGEAKQESLTWRNYMIGKYWDPGENCWKISHLMHQLRETTSSKLVIIDISRIFSIRIGYIEKRNYRQNHSFYPRYMGEGFDPYVSASVIKLVPFCEWYSLSC